MGVVKHPFHSEDYPGVTDKCRICGQASSDSFWTGGGITFETCCSCALEKLPLMIADAIPENYLNDREKLEAMLDRVTAAYWRGLAIRMSNARPQTVAISHDNGEDDDNEVEYE